MAHMIRAEQVCAVVLAGGRGQRMGGSDKGLQTFRGRALGLHALERLRLQQGGAPGRLLINANRNLDIYATWGEPVVRDAIDPAATAHSESSAASPNGGIEFAGPLAGVLSALQACQPQQQAQQHSHLLTVPCDSPLFPLDLLARLAHAMQAQNAEIAMALAPEPIPSATPPLVPQNGQVPAQGQASEPMRRQPVFCLYQTRLVGSLQDYLASGRRKIDGWTQQHRMVEVPFNLPTDDPMAFANANTLDDLRALENR